MPFLKQNRCQIKYSWIFKDSDRLEKLNNSDTKGTKRSVIQWATNYASFKNGQMFRLSSFEFVKLTLIALSLAFFFNNFSNKINKRIAECLVNKVLKFSWFFSFFLQNRLSWMKMLLPFYKMTNFAESVESNYMVKLDSRIIKNQEILLTL